MKQQIKILSAVVIIAMQILSSCSSHKSGFTSRKYTKGIFIASKGKVGKVEKHNQIVVKAEINETPDVEVVKANTNTIATADVVKEPVQPIVLANLTPSKKINKVDKKITASTQKLFAANIENKELKSLSYTTSSISKTNKEFNKSQQNFQKKPSKGALIVLAIFIPLLAVYLKDGIGKSFWINLVLCLLFYLPGIIHALIVVTKK